MNELTNGQKSTDELDNILNNTSIKNFEKYRENSEIDNYANISDYLTSYIKGNNLELKNVIINSGISRDYAYSIVNGNRTHPSRDRLIALCLSCEMSVTELNRAMKICGHSPLYSKDSKDAAIIICINNKIYKVIDVNIFLCEHGLQELELM